MKRLTYRHQDQNGNPTDTISPSIDYCYMSRNEWLEKVALKMANIEDQLENLNLTFKNLSIKCENCKKYDDCSTGAGLTWPCGAYAPIYCGAYAPIRYSNFDYFKNMNKENLASLLLEWNGTEKKVTPYGGHKYEFFGPYGEKCESRPDALKLWMYWLDLPYEEL